MINFIIKNFNKLRHSVLSFLENLFTSENFDMKSRKNNEIFPLTAFGRNDNNHLSFKIKEKINTTLAEGSKLRSSFGGGLDVNLAKQNKQSTPHPIKLHNKLFAFLDSPARGELKNNSIFEKIYIFNSLVRNDNNHLTKYFNLVILARKRWVATSLTLLAMTLILFASASQAENLITKTSIANYGETLYSNFEHFPYVNSDAPKGGVITLGSYGTFDNTNPYILKGQTPAGLSMISDSLMTGSADELMSAYASIAESVSLPSNLSYAVFNINSKAKYNDGVQITAHDFKYSYDMIQEHGAPFLKNFYEDIASVEVIDTLKIKYNFKTKDTMKPVMIAAASSPLPKHFWSKQDFAKITLSIPPSSGAYKIKSLDAGRSITYERVKNYWAKDLNVNIGRNNFDEVKYDYYSDEEVMFEAFKAGKIDFRIENKAARWEKGYDLPAINTGELIKAEIPQNQPMGLQGIFFNTRQEKLYDVRVRKALEKLFNFEYIQKNLLNGFYTRSKNYFNNSNWGYEYSGDEDFAPTVNSTSGVTRENKREAINLFKEAGYILKDSKLVNAETGEQFSIEFLLIAPSMERVTMPYVVDLRKMGIDAKIRKVDTSQYIVRVQDFDFDAMVVHFSFFVPPGVELLSYYGSGAADINGSANYTGIKSEKIDSLIEEILIEKNLETLKKKTRALDKELLQGYYGVPQWYNDKHLIAYWNKFKIPETKPKYGIGLIDTGWIDSSIPDTADTQEELNNTTNFENSIKFKIIGVLILVAIAFLMNRDLKKRRNP